MATLLKEAFTAKIEIAYPLEAGKVAGGIRRIIPITGGTLEGEKIKARVLPIGADWNMMQDNGISLLSARYMIETDDGVIISILNECWLRCDDSLINDIFAGKQVDTSSWYAKTHPKFEAPEGKYEWLNQSVFVGEIEVPTAPNVASVKFFELL